MAVDVAKLIGTSISCATFAVPPSVRSRFLMEGRRTLLLEGKERRGEGTESWIGERGMRREEMEKERIEGVEGMKIRMREGEENGRVSNGDT